MVKLTSCCSMLTTWTDYGSEAEHHNQPLDELYRRQRKSCLARHNETFERVTRTVHCLFQRKISMPSWSDDGCRCSSARCRSSFLTSPCSSVVTIATQSFMRKSESACFCWSDSFWWLFVFIIVIVDESQTEIFSTCAEARFDPIHRSSRPRELDLGWYCLSPCIWPIGIL